MSMRAGHAEMHRPHPVQAYSPPVLGKKSNFFSKRFLSRIQSQGRGFAPPATRAKSLIRQESQRRSRARRSPAAWSASKKQWQVGQMVLHAPHSTHRAPSSFQIGDSYARCTAPSSESWSGASWARTATRTSSLTMARARSRAASSSAAASRKRKRWRATTRSPFGEPASTTKPSSSSERFRSNPSTGCGSPCSAVQKQVSIAQVQSEETMRFRSRRRR